MQVFVQYGRSFSTFFACVENCYIEQLFACVCQTCCLVVLKRSLLHIMVPIDIPESLFWTLKCLFCQKRPMSCWETSTLLCKYYNISSRDFSFSSTFFFVFCKTRTAQISVRPTLCARRSSKTVWRTCFVICTKKEAYNFLSMRDELWCLNFRAIFNRESICGAAFVNLYNDTTADTASCRRHTFRKCKLNKIKLWSVQLNCRSSAWKKRTPKRVELDAEIEQDHLSVSRWFRFAEEGAL